MPIVPLTDQGLLAFATSHKAPFEQNMVLLGLSQPEIDAYNAALIDADAKNDDAEAKRIESKAATEAKRESLNELRTIVGSAIKKIQGQADIAADPGLIYQTAKIPSPTPPSPRPAPEIPTALTGQIDNEGAVVLSWKGSRAFGVTFLIERAFTPVGGEMSEWSLLNTSQQNTYVDDTVPVGQRLVSYRVKAMRNELSSGWTDGVNIMFGQNTVQSQQSSSTGDESMPMAA